MLSFATLPSAASFLTRGSVRSATSTASPEATRSSTPAAVAKSNVRRLPELFSKSGARSCNSGRSAPALSTLISAASAGPANNAAIRNAANASRRTILVGERVLQVDRLARRAFRRFHSLGLVDRLVRWRGQEIDEGLGRERLLREWRGSGVTKTTSGPCVLANGAVLPPTSFATTDELVDLRLGQDRDIDRVFGGDLLFNVLRGIVLDR